MDPIERRVCVVGSGVIGLTCALLLQLNGFKVRLHGDGAIRLRAPGHHTLEYGRIAGYNFARSGRTLVLDNERPYDLELATYPILVKLAKFGNENGILAVKNVVVGRPWFADGQLVPCRLKSTGHWEFETVTIVPRKYLRYLYMHFVALGGKFVLKHVSHLSECPEPIVINCTGLGARELVQDFSVYPLRGQTILVNAEYGSTYIVPREDGTTLLGGTIEPYNYNKQFDQAIADDILNRCKQMSPTMNARLSNAQIIRHGVGLRPCRVGGPRIEAETLAATRKKRKQLIVHNYGHGAWGFQTSWGSALKVLQLLQPNSDKTKAKL